MIHITVLKEDIQLMVMVMTLQQTVVYTDISRRFERRNYG